MTRGRWPWRKADKLVGEGNDGPSSPATRDVDVDIRGQGHKVAGRDQSTVNIDQVIFFDLAQLMRRWPDTIPYVCEAASGVGMDTHGELAVKDLLLRLADRNVASEDLPPILWLSKLIRRLADDGDDPEMRDAFGSIADKCAAQVPSQWNQSEDFRNEPSNVQNEFADSDGDDPCLLIALYHDYYSTDRYRLSIVLYSNGRDGVTQVEEDAAVSIKEIEEFIKLRLPELFQRNRDQLLVEFAVPPEVIGTAFDQWFIPNRPNGLPQEDYQLGERFPVVVRDIERMAPETDRKMWESRWELLCKCNNDGSSMEALRWVSPEENEDFRSLRASLWHPNSHGKACLVFLAPLAGTLRRDLLKAGFEAGIPAAIWLREVERSRQSVRDDKRYLMELVKSSDLRSLPVRVRDQRLEAVARRRPAGHPGTRLGLLWADPSRTWQRPFQIPEPSSNGGDF